MLDAVDDIKIRDIWPTKVATEKGRAAHVASEGVFMICWLDCRGEDDEWHARVAGLTDEPMTLQVSTHNEQANFALMMP